jgi:putative CocE/NonD family hydrolase
MFNELRRLGATILAFGVSVAVASTAVAAPPPATHPVLEEQNVYVPMSDGTKLAADIYRPADARAGERYPCLFEMTPYRKEGRAKEGADFFAGRGFVYMELDARGTGGSEGAYAFPFSVQEQNDGYDAIEWLATRYRYCNGKVGMWGGSYSGVNQYLIAVSPKGTPPHLLAIAPQRGLSDLYRDIVYSGGILNGSFALAWSSATTAYNAEGADPTTKPDPQIAAQALLDHLRGDPIYLDALNHPFDGPFYRERSSIYRLARLNLPAFHLLGWYDGFLRGQLDAVSTLLGLEQSGVVRGPNYAVIGPWNHGGTHFLDYPWLATRLLEWYRYWLADGPRPAWFSEPRITYCEMLAGRDGPCAWRQTNEWPPAHTHFTRYYLNAGGRITTSRQSGSMPIGSWTYDPTAGTGEEAFSKWENIMGISNPAGGPRLPTQRDGNQALEDEWKGLTFTTPVLRTPLTLTGPITLSLQASSKPPTGDPAPTTARATAPLATLGATLAGALTPTRQLADRLAAAIGPIGATQLLPPYFDTDFVVKLADVAPDGTSTLLTTGYLRASHRQLDQSRTVRSAGLIIKPVQYHDQAHLAPPAPDKTYDYEIELWPTSKRFPAGHRLRIALYSADTANHLTLLEPAINTVHAGSYLVLPTTS